MSRGQGLNGCVLLRGKVRGSMDLRGIVLPEGVAKGSIPPGKSHVAGQLHAVPHSSLVGVTHIVACIL